MARDLAPYRTYVIRCWEEQSAQPSTSIYRFTLEIPATGERRGFTSSEELIHALEVAFNQMQTQARTNKTLGEEPDSTF